MNIALLVAMMRHLAADADQRAAVLASAAEDAKRQAGLWRALADQSATAPIAADTSPVSASASWRERIWHVPDETRLTPAEAAEALGCSRSTVYHMCAAKPNGKRDPLPHRKRENKTGQSGRGVPVEFLAGELRSWIARNAFLEKAGTVASIAVRSHRRASQRRRLA